MCSIVDTSACADLAREGGHTSHDLDMYNQLPVQLTMHPGRARAQLVAHLHAYLLT